MTSDGTRAFMMLSNGEMSVIDVATRQQMTRVTLGGGVTSTRLRPGRQPAVRVHHCRGDLRDRRPHEHREATDHSEFPGDGLCDFARWHMFYHPRRTGSLVRLVNVANSTVSRTVGVSPNATTIALSPDDKQIWLTHNTPAAGHGLYGIPAARVFCRPDCLRHNSPTPSGCTSTSPAVLPQLRTTVAGSTSSVDPATTAHQAAHGSEDETSAERALVIVPTYNERENIARLIETVLAQDPRLEVLVVDDGSPDGTGEIVDGIMATNPRVHILRRREEARARHRVCRRLSVGPRAQVRLHLRDGRRLLARPGASAEIPSRDRERRPGARLEVSERQGHRRELADRAAASQLLRQRLRARGHRAAGLGCDRRLQVLSPKSSGSDRSDRKFAPTAMHFRSR